MSSTQNGPGDTESVLAARYMLTAKGLAATTDPEQARWIAKRAAREGHKVTVTPTVFGRVVVECSCQIFGPEGRAYPSNHAGNLAGLTHAIEVLK